MAQRDALFERVSRSRKEALPAPEQALWERFWDDVNTAGDGYSPPKASVRALVRQHLRRGDKVVFVTARPLANGETLGAKLRRDFGSASIEVEFTAMRSKAEILRTRQIAIYYGDSDGDMDDAHQAGAQGVRTKRSSYSSNGGKTSVGGRRECFVIEDSDL